MTVVTGHKCIALWFILLLTLISIVIYLDGGFDKQPYLMFVLFAITDVLYMSSIIWAMISSTTFTLPQRYSHLYNFLYFHRDQVAQLGEFSSFSSVYKDEIIVPVEDMCATYSHIITEFVPTF
ncbi:hypothetical protein Y032_0835g2594 [Ancylostoma ceylanicum]|uniref:Uncharacterized protein n=1 Tax=Ancylostoma ceylanicum TaxID=53326 RepID=A0A016WBN2_9BILA|nr:hypothetical protein Y032_0835g2594 [Ancylostoma ceylanicum]